MENALGLSGIDFSPELNMVRYLQRIRQYPLLSQDEEYALASEYQITKDPQIAQKLVSSHLRLVVKVVSKYRGYGLPTIEIYLKFVVVGKNRNNGSAKEIVF